MDGILGGGGEYRDTFNLLKKYEVIRSRENACGGSQWIGTTYFNSFSHVFCFTYLVQSC